MYDNKIHTIMDKLELNNYELSYIEYPVHQLELLGVLLTPEILEKNGFLQNGMMKTVDILNTKLIIFTLLFIGTIL